MAHTFTPPYNSAFWPPTLPDSKGPEKNLFRHFRRRPCGANVFILSDGSVVQDIATDTPVAISAAGNVPYPWNPDAPGAPYASWTDALGVQQYISLTLYITAVFYGGGGPYQITNTQFTQLTAAGYSACLT